MIRGFLALLIVLTPLALFADEGVLNSLLAPGPLIGGHKDLEGSACFKCHDAGKGVPDEKCLDCHKDIKKFVESKKGFHGLTAESCTKCHSDHKGREYDSVAVDEKKFDHAKSTGYALEGKHADLKCTECHREKRVKKFLRPGDVRYMGQNTTDCRSCHKKDDIHRFDGKYAKQDCNACHSAKAWKTDLKFDHGRDTGFKLEEKHAELKCTDCHLTDKVKKTYKYKWANLQSAQCLACHKDQHGNKLSQKFRGGDCLQCHDQTQWKMGEGFEHGVTGYALKGKHADLKCIECHTQGGKKTTALPQKDFNWTGLKSQCLSCHEDFHKFGKFRSKRYGDPNQCLKCHEESAWKKTHDFVHDVNTRYALDGRHLDLKCTECHLPSGPKNPTKMSAPNQGVYHWENLETKKCETCHANPHIGQFKPDLLAKGCVSCHTTAGWRAVKADGAFDHAHTRFPLTGAHTNVSCKDCHTINGKNVYKFKSVDQKFCTDCHQNVHVKQFSQKFAAQACATCHTTTNFTQRLPFDHAQTAYKLDGAHAQLNCTDCHRPSRVQFGLQKPNISEKKLKSNYSSFMSRYRFPDLGQKQCATCHADFHKGQLGTSCQNCHGVQTWKKVTFDHNKQSQFPLTDKHAGVDCKKCHLPVRGEYTKYKGEKKPLVKFKPVGQACVDCHKDPHKGQFGASCVDCHSARGWPITRDFHRNFTLKGVHFSLECAQCHREQRKLSGVSQDCMICHQKDDIHSGSLPNCRDCHTQSFWEHTNFKHSLTRFPLRGVHRTLECGECHYRNGAAAIYQGLDSRCESCHLQDALSAKSFDHASGGNISNCTSCHRNYFSFEAR